jgi:prefoldin subunit 5
MFADKIQDQISYLEQEIKNVQAELDRVESSKKLLRVFGPKDVEDKPVNL